MARTARCRVDRRTQSPHGATRPYCPHARGDVVRGGKRTQPRQPGPTLELELDVRPERPAGESPSQAGGYLVRTPDLVTRRRSRPAAGRTRRGAPPRARTWGKHAHT